MNWIAYECLCYMIILLIPVSVLYGWQFWVMDTLVGYLIVMIDWYAFPHCKKNMATLKEQGWSTSWQVWLIMFFNLIASNGLVGLIYDHCLSSTQHQYTFTIRTIWQVITNMAITEIFFTSAHTWLHCTEVGSKLHHMHHCCTEPSWSTNLIFHPLDLVVEFSGPVTSIILMHVFVWQNTDTLLTSTLVLHLWYALDHSANLKLPHTKHHTYFNSVYSIYVNWKFGSYSKRDKVRACMMKHKSSISHHHVE